MAKVSIYTQVYNAGAYLKPCIESVQAQTHTDWEHIIADAGSTDGSVEILKEYAAGDSRVKFIQLPENRWCQYEMTEQYATGEYYASLDHDDWWEPEFLERLLDLLQKNSLDIAFTGVTQYYQKEQVSRVLRKLARPVALSMESFAQNYEKYGKFANARWASLMRTDKYLSMKSEYEEILHMGLSWRADTILMLKYLSSMERVGIDNSILQHYRNYAGSQIQQFNPTRLESEAAYYKALQAFLEKFGAWDSKKEDWAKGLFLVEMVDAVQKLKDYSASTEDKLQECGRFLEHPLTRDAMTYRADPGRANVLLSAVKDIVVSSAADGNLPEGAVVAFQKSLRGIAPCCAGAVIPDQFSVFAQETGLVDVLLRDDLKRMQSLLLNLIDAGKYKGQYDVGKMLLGIIPESSPLYGIRDAGIFEAYTEICRFILDSTSITALDLMTGLLLEGKALPSEEAFLQTYLNLSAQLGQAPAFLFGKIRLARHYLQAGQARGCGEILEELREMGAGDHEEVAQIQAQLGSIGEGVVG
ncbi:glycosyltransferase family 2 protein [Acutalibacter caecimuris]|uniref:glycosyltransferase family 2 protein n=1 Tax=Acutalibacter caecimuris TaxID=3093657 RepID=UPI002AC99763|nr:glycosyltransferase family 2 protein [Acutalibacter sp. M00118]